MIHFQRGAAIAAAVGFFLYGFAVPSFASRAPSIVQPKTVTSSVRIHLAQAPIPLTPQTQAQPAVVRNESIGTVATLTGSATVTRNNQTTPLKLNDEIFTNDELRTGANGAMSVTFDDETTFNMGANTTMVMNNLVYQSGGSNNAGLFHVVRGTVAFVAGQVAKTGNMQITTPTATLGIRGTTGVIEVPDNATTPGDVAIKLYNDADGRLGRIEVFGVGANASQRLGVLDRASSGFSIRPGAGGRFAAVALQISPQQAARDRGFVGQLFRAHNVGRQMAIQRRNFRQQNLQRPPGQRGQQLRGPGQQQRATGQQLQRGQNKVVQPKEQKGRRLRAPDLDRPDIGPRGSTAPNFRSAPPIRQFNQPRFR